jgi:hypothetical membrane protein
MVDRLLLRAGIAGPVLFVAVFLVAGVLRAGYDPFRHPVSSLSFGPAGWIQATSFVLTGLLVVAYAVGLRRAGAGLWAPILVALVGVGLVGAGFFLTDPISGYPPGVPPLPRTPHGVFHDLFSTPVFTALPAACFVVAYRLRRTAFGIYSLASGLGVIVFFVLTSVGFAQNPALVGIGGLLQRITLLIGFGWLAALAVRTQRSGINVGA